MQVVNVDVKYKSVFSPPKVLKDTLEVFLASSKLDVRNQLHYWLYRQERDGLAYYVASKRWQMDLWQ